MRNSKANDPDITGLSRLELDSLVGLSSTLDARIARHREVAGSTLEKLAESGSRAILQSVVLNPACPKHVLMKLAPKFPREFFGNPVFPLLLLEEPDLLSRLPITVFRAILKSSDCPASIFDWALLSGGSSHALALAGNDSISGDMLRVIAIGPHVRAAEIATSRLLAMGITIDEKAR